MGGPSRRRFSADKERCVKPGESLIGRAAKAPGCNMLVVLQGTRLVGGMSRDQGTIEIDPAKLGCGPVRLQVIGFGHGVAKTALPKPMDVDSGRAG